MLSAYSLFLFLSVGLCHPSSAFVAQSSRQTLWGVVVNEENKQVAVDKRRVYVKSKWRSTRNNMVNRPHDDEEEALKIIIAGAPASGKGTQCEIIKEMFGVVHLSTGDILRAAVAAESEVGKLAKEYLDSGRLVPDEVIIGVVKERLAKEDCQKCGWLLDGFPRTQAQAKALLDAGVSPDCFLFLNVPDEVLVERVVGRRTDPITGKIYHMTFSPPKDEDILARLVQRSDDTEEKVKVRLEHFHLNVQAIMGSYSDICIEVDGTKPPAEVSAVISEAIATRIARKVAS